MAIWIKQVFFFFHNSQRTFQHLSPIVSWNFPDTSVRFQPGQKVRRRNVVTSRLALTISLQGRKNKDCFLYRPRFHDPRDRIKCLTRGGVSGGLVPPLADSERFSPIPQASDSHRVRYSGASAKMRLLSSLASTSPVTQLIGPGNF